MKQYLSKLYNQEHLGEQESYDVITGMANGNFNTSQIASLLTVFLLRKISANELKGFRSALLDLCLRVDFSNFNTIDVCGTGGDGKNTFNISTLSAFVLAGAGYKVAKHGNYGVSSSVGSSNVLEYLGYEFTNDSSTLNKQLDKANFCMMHAPLFHPAMKAAAPIRKELGVKTFFNMLGPLVNPSFPQNQLCGVFNLEVARLYNYLLQNESKKKFMILHALDGYDEISLTSDFKAISVQGEKTYSPEDLGLTTISPEKIMGGNDVKSSAKIFLNVLQNQATEEQKNVVLTNAAFGIKCMEPNKEMNECQAIAKQSIEAGLAYEKFKTVITK